MNEAEIFIGLKSRDKQAFEMLFQLLYPQLHFFIEQIIKDEVEAEDIALQSLAKFWEKGAEDFEAFLQVRKFIFTIARNAAFDFLRKSRTHKIHQRNIAYISPEAENNLVEQSLFKVEMLQALLNEEVEKLPEQCREAFKLVFIERIPRPLVAQKLNITPGTLNVHCANAVKKLRQVFSNRQLITLLALAGIHYN